MRIVPQTAALKNRLVACLIVTAGVAPVARSQTRGRTGDWTLGNRFVRREIAFDHQGLENLHWQNLADAREFVDPALEHLDGYCHEFRFDANGRAYTGNAAFSLVHAQPATDPAGDRTLDLDLASTDGALTVTLHYALPADSTAIRQSLTITNRRSQPMVLSQLSIACEPLEPAPPADLLAYGGYGETPREIFFTGRSDDVAILLESARTGDGVAVLSEVPGVLKRTEVGVIGKWHQWEPGVVAMYDTDLFPFERTLAPGETFDSAAVSFLLYRRGTAQDPHWLIPQYVVHHVARPVPSEAPRWMFNTWEPWETKIGSAQLLGVERAVAQSGFGIFVIDDGWEQKRGDNAVNPVLFPHGLASETAIAQQTGMQFGLWFPLADVDPSAPVYLQHPDWACHDRFGAVRHMAGSVLMNLTSPYRDEVTDRLAAAIQQYHLRYIKLDLTTAFNTYGEPPGCYGPGGERQTSAADREYVTRTYEALTTIAQRLHARFPDLLLDYSFELWGGKHLIDYGLLREADLDWISNVTDRTPEDAGPRAARMLLYQRGMAIPTETMLIGNLQAETGSWQVRAATEMGSGPLLLGDFSRLSAEDRAHYASWIARFRALRSRVPLNESFFPLGSWRQPRSDRWDGFARFSAAGEGIIVLFRNDAHDTAAQVAVPGFPDGKVTARAWTSSQTFDWTGSQLRQGVDVPFGHGPVVVLELNRPR
ncbi:MAG: alpha-galactosidase [Acidobacteriaceae bacterium]